MKSNSHNNTDKSASKDDVPVESNNLSFASLGLKKDILSAISSLGFKHPTDVQKEVIPRVLAKEHVVFTSRTGSGKTIGYAAGFFGRIEKKKNLQMLIIVPTRELCLQVGTELKKFGEILDFNVGMLYGGHSMMADKQTLSRRLNIIVATPGRLIEHINAKTLKVGDVSALVFDESDQMFDTGFYSDCIYIKSRVSVNAQIVLSSATITPKVELFLKKYVKHYEFVKVGSLIPSAIIQDVLFCEIKDKNDLLVKFFLGEEFSRALVFVNTKSKVNSVFDTLTAAGISTSYISSDLDQKKREKCISDFKNAKFNVLVSTDVASRGLDIKEVDIVVNYDVPPRTEFYVHRIGRCGRIGERGYALTLVCPEDESDISIIEHEFDIDFGIVNTEFELVNDD